MLEKGRGNPTTVLPPAIDALTPGKSVALQLAVLYEPLWT